MTQAEVERRERFTEYARARDFMLANVLVRARCVANCDGEPPAYLLEGLKGEIARLDDLDREFCEASTAVAR